MLRLLIEAKIRIIGRPFLHILIQRQKQSISGHYTQLLNFYLVHPFDSMNENVGNGTILEILKFLLIFREIVILYLLCWVWLFYFLFDLAVFDNSVKFNLSWSLTIYTVDVNLFLYDSGLLVQSDSARNETKNFKS